MEEWEVCVQTWSNPDRTARLHSLGETAVHEDPYLHRTNSSSGGVGVKCLFRRLLLIWGQTQPTETNWRRAASLSSRLQSLFIKIVQIWTDVLKKKRKKRKSFQFLSKPSSFFISSEGGWLLPVSCPELSGLELAFVDLCRRVPLPMQRMRFLKVAHISSSL